MVVMPDHVHLLMALSGVDDLSVALARITSGSSRRVNAGMGRADALWASGYHDHALRQEEAIEDVVHYIVANPVRSGLLEQAGDYRFSWSRWGPVPPGI
jgi:REP element-mobilizing transposase RayT